MLIDIRPSQSTPESRIRASYEGAKRRKGSKAHLGTDTLGHLFVLKVTAAGQGNRARVAALAKQSQRVTGQTVRVAMSIKDERVRPQPKPPANTGFGWMRSSIPWPSALPCWHPHAGSSNTASLGRQASALLHGTTSSIPRSSKIFITSPSACPGAPKGLNHFLVASKRLATTIRCGIPLMP